MVRPQGSLSAGFNRQGLGFGLTGLCCVPACLRACVLAFVRACPARRRRNVLRFCGASTRGGEKICETRWSRIFFHAQPPRRAHCTPKPGHIAPSPHWAGSSIGMRMLESNHGFQMLCAWKVVNSECGWGVAMAMATAHGTWMSTSQATWTPCPDKPASPVSPAFPASPDQLREQSVVIGQCVGLWGERCAVIQLRAIKIGAHPHPKNTAQIFNPA